MSVLLAVLLASTVKAPPPPTGDTALVTTVRPCTVSWYDAGGAPGASGRLQTTELYAAHKKLPFGTSVGVAVGLRSVHVTVLDRGPFVAGRDLDVSRVAAGDLHVLSDGVVTAECSTVSEELLPMDPEVIRLYPTGWLSLHALQRRDGGSISRAELISLIMREELVEQSTAKGRIRLWVRAGILRPLAGGRYELAGGGA